MVASWVLVQFSVGFGCVLTACFDNLQKALCAPQLEQDWCSRLLQKKLTFGQGTPLLSTTGFDWDYCGKEDLVEDMRASVQQLHDKKGAERTSRIIPCSSRSPAPAKASPDCSQSSRAWWQSVSKISRTAGSVTSRSPFSSPARTAWGLGTGPQRSSTPGASWPAAWQLREANQQAFDDAGAPTNFAKFRADCDTNLVPEDVIGLVLPPDATVVIGLDGMHNLPGFPQHGEQTGKEAPFYQVTQEVCRLVNQDTSPLVVACVTATQSVSQGLAHSPQARKYLKLPRVTAVTRNNSSVLPPDDLIQLLAVDMGGHGRALEPWNALRRC